MKFSECCRCVERFISPSNRLQQLPKNSLTRRLATLLIATFMFFLGRRPRPLGSLGACVTFALGILLMPVVFILSLVRFALRLLIRFGRLTPRLLRYCGGASFAG